MASFDKNVNEIQRELKLEVGTIKNGQHEEVNGSTLKIKYAQTAKISLK